MKIVLVAVDVAPSSVFALLVSELLKRGIEAYDFLGQGKNLTLSSQELVGFVKSADFVLIGMSSSLELAQAEIAAARVARSERKRFGFFSDTYGCYTREWFKEFRQDADFIFVTSDDEADKAQSIFPTSRVVVSGNPMWEHFCSPTSERGDVRKKLRIEKEVCLLVPGTKIFPVNFSLLDAVIEACCLNKDRQKSKIVFSPHPGDQNMNSYRPLSELSPIPLCVVARNEFSASALIPAADIVVDCASTIGIEAAHQLKPVINYFSAIARERLIHTSGSAIWRPSALGVAMQINGDPIALSRAIKDLLNVDSRVAATMKYQQEQVYLLSCEKGRATRVMISFFENLK